MPLQVQPYLSFEGRCEEALAFYSKALGARLGTLMRYRDNPEPAPGGGCADGAAGAGPAPDMVMHADFTVGATQLMASDGMGSGQPDFRGINLSLNPADVSEAERLFHALADGGQVRIPLGKTFFSPAFGMLADRFGVGWIVVVPQ